MYGKGLLDNENFDKCWREVPGGCGVGWGWQCCRICCAGNVQLWYMENDDQAQSTFLWLTLMGNVIINTSYKLVSQKEMNDCEVKLEMKIKKITHSTGLFSKYSGLTKWSKDPQKQS